MVTSSAMKGRAFTLIELAIVIAIIAILAALLLSRRELHEGTRAFSCLPHQHSIRLGSAWVTYVQDNQNKLPVMYDRGTNNTPPAGPAINQVLLPYVSGVSNIFQCPSDNHNLFELTGSSYAWNDLLNGQDADRLQMLTNAYLLHQIFVVFDKEKFHLSHGERRAINYFSRRRPHQ